MNRISMFAFVLVLGGAASAQRAPLPVSPNALPLDPVVPATIQAIDANGNPFGPVYSQNDLKQRGRAVGSWRVGFDTVASAISNPTGNFPPYSGAYGSLSGPLFINISGYKNYAWTNDMDLPKTSRGYAVNMQYRHARFVRFGFRWNPSALPGGTSNMAAKIYCANTFDRTTFGPAFTQKLGGIMITRPNLALGSNANKDVFIDLSNGPLTLPFPKDGGSVVIELGTYNTDPTVWEPLNSLVEASPLLSEMGSPADPVESRGAGSNPSQSDDNAWQDDSNPGFPGLFLPNYEFEDYTNTGSSSSPYAELYSLDYRGSFDGPNALGFLQPAVALLERTDVKTINGSVTFNSLADLSFVPNGLEIQVRNSTSGVVLSTQTVALQGAGPTYTFNLADPNPTTGGTYRLSTDPLTYLRRVSGVVNTTTAGTLFTAPAMSLINGDADSDTEVGPNDLQLVLDNFSLSTTPAILNVDLDKDGEIGPGDLQIVLDNFSLGDD